MYKAMNHKILKMYLHFLDCKNFAFPSDLCAAISDLTWTMAVANCVWLIARLNSSMLYKFWSWPWTLWCDLVSLIYCNLLWVQPAKSILLSENQEYEEYHVTGNDNSGVKACCWQRFSMWNRWLCSQRPAELGRGLGGGGRRRQGVACNIRFIVSAPTPFSTCPKRQINPIPLSPSVHRHDTSVSAIIHCLTCFWDTSHATLTWRMWLLHGFAWARLKRGASFLFPFFISCFFTLLFFFLQNPPPSLPLLSPHITSIKTLSSW